MKLRENGTVSPQSDKSLSGWETECEMAIFFSCVLSMSTSRERAPAELKKEEKFLSNIYSNSYGLLENFIKTFLPLLVETSLSFAQFNSLVGWIRDSTPHRTLMKNCGETRNGIPMFWSWVSCIWMASQVDSISAKWVIECMSFEFR